MSDTIRTSPVEPVSPVNQSTTQSTSGMASGLTGSAGVVFVWLLSLRGIAVPPDVALAVAALVAPLIHYAFVRLTMAPAPKLPVGVIPVPRP